jgi:broad specificity phosphatase PhoE
MRLYLLRHGESEGNAQGVVQGWLDTPLTQLGRRQALQTAPLFEGQQIASVVSSPLLRAHATAMLIAERLGVTVETDQGLMEYNHGELSGLSMPDIRARFPEIAEAGIASSRTGTWPSIPGEEGRATFFERVMQAINSLAERNATLLVVTHGGFINAACHAILGMDYVGQPGRFRTGNCSITEIGRDRNGAFLLHRHNDGCHLGVKTLPLEA